MTLSYQWFVYAVIVAIFCTLVATGRELSQQEWDELETLLQKVDKADGKIIFPDNDPDDESTLLFGNQEDNSEKEQQDDVIGKKNPCENHICGWGKECLIEKNKPKCECTKRCPDVPSFDANDRVCSSHNQTFESICHLYRERCLCKNNDIRCIDLSYKHLHLEYLGACKELQPCTENHMAQFSERMSDWLFQVMKDLKKRQELHNEKWIQMLQEAEYDDHLKHVYPVIWKYCDLDRKPHDKAVTHQELIPIIAPVMPMESCIKPFLKSCDLDKNDMISLKEWGMCLGLREEEITERC